MAHDFGGALVKNIADPVDMQDAMTKNTAMSTVAGIPRYYKSGVQKSSVWMYDASAVTSSGAVVFYLTNDGTSIGNAVFTNVYTESINLLVYSSANQYQFSNPVVSSDKKTLTVTVGQLGTVLLGVIQFISASNGVTVYLQVKGD